VRRDALRGRLDVAVVSPGAVSRRSAARWLDSIPLIMKRAGMYARDGREMETVAGQLLRDLAGSVSGWPGSR
jgi:hypothetical protein